MSSDGDMHAVLREQLLDALYGSVHEVPAWRSFLDRACALLGCDCAAVVIGAPGEGQIVQLSSGSPDAQATLFARLSSHPIPQPAATGTLFREPWGEGHALFLVVNDRQKRRGMIALFRKPGRPAISTRGEALVGSLAAACVRAMQIYFRITYLERRKIALETTLETSRIGVILANGAGHVLLTNGVADRILAQADGLRVLGGRLYASSQAETAALLAELARKAQEQGAHADYTRYTPVAVTRTDHNLPLTLIVRPGPAFGPLREPLQRTAMLILRDPEVPHVVPPAIIERLFGLSPAESLLASELARGCDLEQAAAVIGVSRNTLRSQLQNVFVKTGTKRQSELIRVLLSSAAMSIFSPHEPHEWG